MNSRAPLFTLVAALLCLSSEPVFAAILTVTNLNDSGAGSLRQAIADANPSGDVIQFAVTGAINLESGLSINKSLTISGPGSEALNVRGQGEQVPFFRVFSIGNVTATISGITISNGRIGADGAGVSIGAGADVTITHCTISGNSIPFNGRGAGIFNLGSLLLVNSTVSGNRTDGRDGGGVANFGTLTIGACTFVGNRANARGGGLYNAVPGALVIDSTFVNNSTGVATEALGGAICNGGLSSAGLTVSGCTFTGNFGALGRDIANDGAEATAVTAVRSSLLQSGSPNLGSRGSGGINSQGYNVCRSDGGGFLIATGDQINTDALLDAAGLQQNGGPTRTIALLNGSPAIDKGRHFGSVLDQRGQPRPVDNPAIANAPGGEGTDAGAYEAPLDALQPGQPAVNTTADHDDGVAGAADCTLREAIARSNAVAGTNTITFAPGLTGTITLQTSAGGGLSIQDSTIIQGPGARLLSIDGFTNHRPFTVTGGSGNIITGLTIKNGWAANSTPGGSASGGGIHNSANLTLEDCTFDFNRVIGGFGAFPGGNGGSGNGGAIANIGTLTINRCTFKNNGAFGSFGAVSPPPDDFTLTIGGQGGDGNGGAIFNETGRSLTVRNSTFSGNNTGGGSGGDAAFGGNGGKGAGGAIHNKGTMSLTACTFSGNSGIGGAGGAGTFPSRNGSPGVGTGGLVAASGMSALGNTLCAGNVGNSNSARDVNGTFTSSGYNLIGNANFSSGFNASGDQTGTSAAPIDPKLGPLQNNGGPTDTRLLLTGSPALDSGQAFGLIADQRGAPRPIDDPNLGNAPGSDGSDIGSVEADPEQVGPTFVVTTTADHDDGVCSLFDCTMREAINAANGLAGDNTITFAPAVMGAIELSAALPTLSSNVTVAGPGANVLAIRRNSGGDYRIFTISNGTNNGPTVTLSGLTIANGNAQTFPGDSGGGIMNDHSTLALRQCVLSGNRARSFGGGVFNTGVDSSAPLTIEGCTFAGNTATANSGGGLSNSAAAVTISNSTFSGNTAPNGGAIVSAGGFGAVSATLSLTSCTFSGNGSAGIFNSIGGSVTLANNIFAAGAGANLNNIGNAIVSLGYNLSSDPAGGDAGSGPGGFLNATGDLRNTDALLGALASNGGPTQTHLPLRNSPLLDRGKSFGLSIDQRGLPRLVTAAHFPDAPGGDGTDIGALEINPFGSHTDADGDGMADEWEIFYGVDAPDADTDGDGESNLNESFGGTDPRDSSSFVPRIISVTRDGDDLVITFHGVAGRTFRLEHKEGLADPWMSIPPDLTPPTTGPAQFRHVDGMLEIRSFYRLRLLP